MFYCDFFKAMFNSDFKEKNQDQIELKDLDINSFAHFLNLINLEGNICGKYFIYTKKI